MPFTITAWRTRRYASTLYIHRTIHGVGYNPMDGGARSNLQPPFVSDYPPARDNLPPPLTDRDGETLELEADHRRHAEVENAIRDLKYGVGLNHLPSGRFAANAAWLSIQVMAHNLARWVPRIGLGEQLVTTKTLRRRFFSLAGRLTRSARRLTLHLPRGWPWEAQFSRAMARLRAIPLPA